ncbi:hypothetical protein L195_g019409, partial [Trifolium pratense]
MVGMSKKDTFAYVKHRIGKRITSWRSRPLSKVDPSFTWRSIWKSKQVLVHGCRWRIGDERSIKVMNEQWLRVEDGRWIETPQNQGSKEAWNVVGLGNVLQQCLNENQCIHELIFSICSTETAQLAGKVAVLMEYLAKSEHLCVERQQIERTTDWYEGTNLIQRRLSTVEGEAITLKEAIEQGLNRGLSHVIFESNSKLVVDAISSRQVGSLK